MLKAIEKLKEFNINLSEIVNEYIESNETKITDNKLYYKNIPEGLFLLSHNKRILSLNNRFKNFGTMLDLARGAVFKVSYIKELIYKQALMGVNQIWLYIEDVFELEDYPTFGYFRGKYTNEEIKEIVEFSLIFGVELIPSIQVLGHHEQFLKWPNSLEYRDQDKVLLVENENTNNLIEAMLKWCKLLFKTNKIHIGMDESFGLGFGNYYKQKGYKKPLDIFIDHLISVNKLAIDMGFNEVMIWSDMFFRFYSETDYYYDTTIKLPAELVNKIPNNVSLVYWDYYNHNNKIVDQMIKNHLITNRKVIFASGTWIWTRLNYDHKKTEATAFMHLEESINNNVEDFILTQWMDDGAYGNHISTLLGVFDLANKAMDIKPDTETYYLITGDSYNECHLKSKINNTTMSQVGLLWDDPLLSIYTNNYVGNEIKNFTKFIDEQKELVDLYNKKDHEFEYLISKINYLKLDSRFKLVTQYSNKKLNSELIDNYKNINIHLNELNDWYIKTWNKYNKLYGLEIIQSRIGTQIIRMNTIIKLIEEYQDGDIIDVLEEKIIKDQFLSLKYHDIAYSVKPF